MRPLWRGARPAARSPPTLSPRSNVARAAAANGSILKMHGPRSTRTPEGPTDEQSAVMSLRIDQDHRRFREIVRGKIKQNLRKYITQGEMLGKKGKEVVSIPLPQIDIPHFRFGNKQTGGVGQGEGDPGDALGQGAAAAGRRQGGRSAGRAPARGRRDDGRAGADPRRGAAAAAHRAQGQRAHRRAQGSLHRRAQHRARVAAPLPAHLQAGAAAADRDRARTIRRTR